MQKSIQYSCNSKIVTDAINFLPWWAENISLDEQTEPPCCVDKGKGSFNRNS